MRTFQECLVGAAVAYNGIASTLTYFGDDESLDALFVGGITMFSVEALALTAAGIYKYCANDQQDTSDYVEMTDKEAETGNGHESEGENETKHSESNIFNEQQNTPGEQQTTPQQEADVENQLPRTYS